MLMSLFRPSCRTGTDFGASDAESIGTRGYFSDYILWNILTDVRTTIVLCWHFRIVFLISNFVKITLAKQNLNQMFLDPYPSKISI